MTYCASGPRTAHCGDDFYSELVIVKVQMPEMVQRGEK